MSGNDGPEVIGAIVEIVGKVECGEGCRLLELAGVERLPDSVVWPGQEGEIAVVDCALPAAATEASDAG
jgi:hypothetical protein